PFVHVRARGPRGVRVRLDGQRLNVFGPIHCQHHAIHPRARRSPGGGAQRGEIGRGRAFASRGPDRPPSLRSACDSLASTSTPTGSAKLVPRRIPRQPVITGVGRRGQLLHRPPAHVHHLHLRLLGLLSEHVVDLCPARLVLAVIRPVRLHERNRLL